MEAPGGLHGGGMESSPILFPMSRAPSNYSKNFEHILSLLRVKISEAYRQDM